MTFRRSGLLVLACLSPLPCLPLAACAGKPATSLSSSTPGAAVASLEIGPWTTHLGEHHPLVGRIYDVRQGRSVSREQAVARVRAASVVVLGEKHDNPDHHRIEAALLGVAVEGRKAALVVEMIPRDKQPALTGFHGTPEALALAVDWDHSGWPAFAEYRPVFATALDHQLPIYAGDMPQATAHLVAHHGLAAVDPALATRFDLAAPLPVEEQKRLEQEVADVHCDMLPPAFLPAMSLAQRVRDASLAGAVLDARGAAGERTDVTVLVGGDGHARRDRAVPALLVKAGVPADKVLSVAILEVDDSWTQPSDYARELHASTLPFDLVWFTPRANEDDPCAKMTAPKK
jgi:uncharacterized iron-regulated protein